MRMILGVMIVLASVARAAQMDALRLVDSTAVQHVASGWLFPQTIGNFTRDGEPNRFEGTDDYAANYRDTTAGSDLRATVYVYPADSRAGDASLANAKAILESGLKGAMLAQLWSEGPFRAGNALPLVGYKAFYKIGLGKNSSQTNLYFFDTGRWIIKARVSGSTNESDVFLRIDDFVRKLPWESLALDATSCTGSACRIARAMPVHGLLIELAALLTTGKELKIDLPKKPAPCDAQALSASLSAPPADPGQHAEIVGYCAPASGRSVAIVRMLLPEAARAAISDKSPEGLSLRNPLVFAVLRNGKTTAFTALQDGTPDTADLQNMITALGGKTLQIFAQGDRNGSGATPLTRFIE
jgi:hypothetical protein